MRTGRARSRHAVVWHTLHHAARRDAARRAPPFSGALIFGASLTSFITAGGLKQHREGVPWMFQRKLIGAVSSRRVLQAPPISLLRKLGSDHNLDKRPGLDI